MEKKKKSLNWPLIVISGFGVIAVFLITFIFVQGLAINTVREAIIFEKAYPHIKPQEYLNELKLEAKQNKLQIKEISRGQNSFLIQITRPELMDKILNEYPNIALLSVVNVVIYDLGDGTGLVATNPYIWSMISKNAYINDIAKGFSEELSMVFDSIFWSLKKKKSMLKE